MFAKRSTDGAMRKAKGTSRVMRSCAIAVLEMLESRMLLSVTRIAAISDIGDNNTTDDGEWKVAQMIARWDAPGSALDAIITSGDNYQGSTAPGDNTYYEWLGRWGYQRFVDQHRYYPSPGNHDWYAGNLDKYSAYFNYLEYPLGDPHYDEDYYCYDKVFGSAVHVFFVDSDDHDLGGNTPDSEQALWLRDKLAVSTTPWNIVVFHHPPYTSGLSHTPSANMAWPFKDWGADAVITGHVHNYERFSIDGLPYFVNGVGGHENNVAFEYPPATASLLRDNGHFGGILITADESTISFNYITTDGTIDTPRDTVTLTEPTPTSVTLSAKGEAWTYFHPYDNTDSTHANPGNVNGHYYDQDFYTTWFTSNDYSADARDDRVA